MNNIILGIIGVLLLTSLVLLAFYYRDVLEEGNLQSEYSCEPLDANITDVTSTSFKVTWETANECLGLVKYGTSVDSMNFMALNDETNVSKLHSVFVKNAKPATAYYLIIFSDDTDYGFDGAPLVVTTNPF